MKYLLFLGIASLAGAQISQIQLRVVTFQKAGAATALEAAVPDSDESLYAALEAEAGASTGGKVRRVFDQTLVIRSGRRSKVDAFRDYGYPPQLDPDPAEWMTYPVAMMSRFVGQSLEAEATAGEEDEEAAGRGFWISIWLRN